MTIEQEDKLRKKLSFFLLAFMWVMPFLNRIESDIVFSCVTAFEVLFLTLMFILIFRKFSRDRAEGKNLSGYKRALYFIGLTFLIGLGFISYHLYYS